MKPVSKRKRKKWAAMPKEGVGRLYVDGELFTLTLPPPKSRRKAKQ